MLERLAETGSRGTTSLVRLNNPSCRLLNLALVENRFMLTRIELRASTTLRLMLKEKLNLLQRVSSS